MNPSSVAASITRDCRFDLFKLLTQLGMPTMQLSRRRSVIAPRIGSGGAGGLVFSFALTTIWAALLGYGVFRLGEWALAG
jgi:hypothetical protein